MDFPELACRVPHLDERIHSNDRDVRLDAVRAVIRSEGRNSKLFPPFLRAALNDPDPEIAWIALSGLGDYGVPVAPGDLPPRVAVPLIGTVDTHSADDLFTLRRRTMRGPVISKPTQNPGSVDADKGWALRTLLLIGDGEAGALAEPLAKSENAFVRFTAGVTLLRTGNVAGGTAVLRSLIAAKEHYYDVAAAEVLARRGDRSALRDLQQVLEKPFPRDAQMKHLVLDILADITGVYFFTAAEWDAWLQRDQTPTR